jgi:copper(I)-binding protein
LFVTGAAHAGGLTVTDGWIRALPSNVPSGGYFHLKNDSGRQVVLTGASSSACGMLMLHRSETASGMASMSDVAGIPIAAGAGLSFSPGGYHLMCMQPTNAIKPGNKVPVTLVFEDGSKVTSDFVVRNANGH